MSEADAKASALGGALAAAQGYDLGAVSQTARIMVMLALERTFGVWFRGEVCKRSFDGWPTIQLCNAAKGEIFT